MASLQALVRHFDRNDVNKTVAGKTHAAQKAINMSCRDHMQPTRLLKHQRAGQVAPTGFVAIVQWLEREIVALETWVRLPVATETRPPLFFCSTFAY